MGRNASPDRSGQLLRLNENSQNVEAWNFISAAEPGAQAWLLSPRREKYRAGTIPNSNLLRVGVERIILWQEPLNRRHLSYLNSLILNFKTSLQRV